MKLVLMVFMLLGVGLTARAACRVSVHGPEWAAIRLEKILKLKGYEVIDENGDGVNPQVMTIEASGYSWSDGPEKFSYAVPKIKESITESNASACPRVQEWDFSCQKNVFHKKAAIECMLDKVQEKMPASR